MPGRRVIAEIERRRDFRRRHIRVARGTRIAAGTTIGRYTNINAASHIGECDIGSFCAIAGRLVVRSTNHELGYANMQDAAQRYVIESNVRVAGFERGRVVIGDACWLGDSVIILPGGSVGPGAVIGAGSVVTRAVPPFAVAVGNPARVIKHRFPDATIELLLQDPWWDWPVPKIRAHRRLFETRLNDVSTDEIRRLLNTPQDS